MRGILRVWRQATEHQSGGSLNEWWRREEEANTEKEKEENTGEKGTAGLLNDIQLWSRSLKSRGEERRGELMRCNEMGEEAWGLLHSCC